jgi:hypothetical protein
LFPITFLTALVAFSTPPPKKPMISALHPLYDPLFNLFSFLRFRIPADGTSVNLFSSLPQCSALEGMTYPPRRSYSSSNVKSGPSGCRAGLSHLVFEVPAQLEPISL